jgi:hypothetical protein
VNACRPPIKPPDDAPATAHFPLPTVPCDDAPDMTVLTSPIATCADAPNSAVCDSTATVPRRPHDPGVLRKWSDTSGQAARMRGGGGATMSDPTVTMSAYDETANLPPAQSDTPCTMRLPDATVGEPPRTGTPPGDGSPGYDANTDVGADAPRTPTSGRLWRLPVPRLSAARTVLTRRVSSALAPVRRAY